MRPLSLALALAPLACADSSPTPYPVPEAITTEALTFDDPPSDVTCMAFVPGSNALFLGTRDGELLNLRLDQDTVTTHGTFTVPHVYAELDCGLLALAFAPDFAEHPALYMSHCVSKTESVIVRQALDGNLAPAGAPVEIFRAGDAAAQRPWHNVGAIGFEPDGTLWALLGDKTVKVNGQDLDDELGALVRMIPNAQGGAQPAPDNPFAEDASDDSKSPFIYAWGLRSPWRGTRDVQGRFFIGDVGENRFEEVNVVTQPAENFGWSTAEGPCHDSDEAGCDAFTDPVVWWSRKEDDPFLVADAEAEPSGSRVVWVGPAYARTGSDDRYHGLLDGRILYGDLCVGFMRGLVVDENGARVDDQPLGHLAGATAMAIGPDGFIYASTFGKCTTDSAPRATTFLRLVPVPGSVAK